MSFSPVSMAASPDRRTEPRNRVECPARLQLISGVREGLLWDLSIAGARFQTDSPPTAGISGFLAWHAHEAFCKVMWVKGDMCGVAFDRPLAGWIVDGTLQEEARRAGPVATVTNIALGKKRSRI